MSSPFEIVHPGGCYLNDEFIRCALDEIHCQGLQYKSSRELRASGDPQAERCHQPHPDFVGMCTSGMDSYHCTGHATNCVISSKFVPNVPYCSLQYNHIPDRDTHLALYGNCRHPDNNSNVCVWSQDDCPSGRVFSAASFSTYAYETSIDDLCTCEKVVTGACVFQNDWTCAVSADACDPQANFVTWQAVQESGRDCRLCPAFDKTNVSKAPIGRLAQGGNGSKCSAGVLSGTAIGSLLIGMVAAWILNGLLQSCNHRKSEKQAATTNMKDAEAVEPQSDAALPSLDSQCEPVQVD